MPEHGGPKCTSKAKKRAEAQAKAKAAKENCQGGDEDELVDEKWSSEDDGKKKGKKTRAAAKRGVHANAQKAAGVKQEDDADVEVSGRKGKKAAGEHKCNTSGGYSVPGGVELAAGFVVQADDASHYPASAVGAIRARVDLEVESWVIVSCFLPMGTKPELAVALGPDVGCELARLLVTEFWPIVGAAEAPGHRDEEKQCDILKQLFSLVASSRRVAVLLAPLQKASPLEFNSRSLNVSRGVQEWIHIGEPCATAIWLWFDAMPLQLRYDADLVLVLLKGGEIRVVRREDWKRVASVHATRRAICFDFAEELLVVGAGQGPGKLSSDWKLVKYDLADPEMPGVQFVLPADLTADAVHCLHLLGTLPNGGHRLLLVLGREGVERGDYVLLASCGGKDEGVLMRIDASQAVGIQPRCGGNAVFCVAPHVDKNGGQQLQLWDFDDAIRNASILIKEEGITFASLAAPAVDVNCRNVQGVVGSYWPAVLARGCKSRVALNAGGRVVAAAASQQLQLELAPSEVEVSATLLEVQAKEDGHRELTALAGVHMRDNSLGEQLVVHEIELIAGSLLLLLGSYVKSDDATPSLPAGEAQSTDLLLWAWHIPSLRIIAGDGPGLSLGRAPFGPWTSSAAAGSWAPQSRCPGLFAFGHYFDVSRDGGGAGGRGWAVVCEGALAGGPKLAVERDTAAQKSNKNKSLRTSKDAAKSVKSRGAARSGGGGRR